MEYLGKIDDCIYENFGIEKVRNTVRAIILNDKKEIGLLHIECVDDFGNRNHYETPGGGVEENELYEDALRREVKEELGYTIKNIKEIGYIDIQYNLLKRIDRGYFYYCEMDEFVGQKLTKDEVGIIKEVKWFSLNEIDDIYNMNIVYNVGILIHKRDYKIINKAKELKYI